MLNCVELNMEIVIYGVLLNLKISEMNFVFVWKVKDIIYLTAQNVV